MSKIICCTVLLIFRDPTICPISRTPITVSTPYFVDKHAKREIMSMICRCNNANDGCTWQGPISEFEVIKTIIIPIFCVGKGCK